MIKMYPRCTLALKWKTDIIYSINDYQNGQDGLQLAKEAKWGTFFCKPMKSLLFTIFFTNFDHL